MAVAAKQLPVGRMSAAGKRAARTIFNHGPTRARYVEHFEPAYAKAALDELAYLVEHKTPGLYAEQQAGIDDAAQELHVHPERALAEIAQNADDCHATTLRLALRDGPAGRELLCMHNGTRVTLRDAVGMTFAYISGKREDARSKGKFGIGLKTIAGMASRFEVHCEPYHFLIERQHPQWTEPRATIPGFWDATAGHTLLILHLLPGYDEDGAVEWLGKWGTKSMIFLDTLRCVSLDDLQGNVIDQCVVDVQTLQPLMLPLLSHPVEVRTIADMDEPSKTWTVYVTEMEAPAALRRAHKSRERTTPVGLAVPGGDQPAEVFAGLPLDEPSDLPFSVHGQFDPDQSRAQVRATPWNEFVIKSIGELATAVLIALFRTSPRSAWRVVPLSGESAGREGWTVDRFAGLVEHMRAAVKETATIDMAPEGVPISDLVYETEVLENVLTIADLAKLQPGGTPLALRDRDPDGAWRAVLHDLACGSEVDVRSAIATLDWDDPPRPPEWFARLIELALSDIPYGGARLLESTRCVLLADDTRRTPSEIAAEGFLLTASEETGGLGGRLGLLLVASQAFVSACNALEHAKEWLADTIGLSEKPRPEEALVRLARRTAKTPMALEPGQVVAVRDALSRLSAGKVADLGPKIGARVTVRGYETSRAGKRTAMDVTPCDAYLPAAIDGHGADGFPQAGRSVVGLRWIHPSFAELLKVARGSGKLSSRPFFAALGAHGAPRIQKVRETQWLHDEAAAPISAQAPSTQRRAIEGLDGVNGLKNDYDSSDLERVLDHIVRLRGSERQRAARALVLAVDREWTTEYSGRAQARAMHGYGWWYGRGDVPATWLARVQSTAFLTSESGRRRSPTELALRSDAYIAVMGEERGRFCKELVEGDISTDVAGMLGFDARPRAARIIEQLRVLRDRWADRSMPHRDLQERVRASYLALAAYCREARGAMQLSPRDQVDNVTVEELSSAFSQGAGLIFVAERWHGPNEVFRGAPIFRERRPFVSAEARDLWEALRINEPGASDCIAVLQEIEREDGAPDPYLLTDIYERIETELRLGRRPRGITKLPLWTGAQWQAVRPIYAVAQQGLARALAKALPVWQAPCALSALTQFMEDTRVDVLDSARFEPQGIGPGHRAAGKRIQPHFLAALREFAKLVSNQHPEVHRAADVGFDELELYDLVHSSKLEVRVHTPRGVSTVVPVQVFASAERRLIAFRDFEALGSYDVGGMAIAALFGESWTTPLSPLWELAWKRADPDNLREKVRLAREEDVEGDPLEALLKSRAGRKAGRALVDPGGGQPVGRGTSKQRRGNRQPVKALPRRRLKDFSGITFGKPVISGEDDPGTQRKRRRRGLKDPPPAAPPPPPTNEPRGIPEYNEEDKQRLAFEVLASALKSLDGSNLDDYHHVRNIGSDSLDDLRRYFEMKAHAGDIPNEIEMTAGEIERALREQDKYFLAVIGGLEAGELIIKIFARPLVALDVVDSGSLRFSGVRTKRGLVLRPQSPDQDGQRPSS